MTTTETAELLARELKESNSEMFEDGVEADLHDAGITTLASAYRQGKEDQIDEAFEQLPIVELLNVAKAAEEVSKANTFDKGAQLERALTALRAKLPK